MAFERIGNLEKSEFQSRFGRLWRSTINLTEFDREESICGFGKMEQRLMDYQEQCEKEKKRMTSVLTSELIEKVTERADFCREPGKGRGTEAERSRG